MYTHPQTNIKPREKCFPYMARSKQTPMHTPLHLPIFKNEKLLWLRQRSRRKRVTVCGLAVDLPLLFRLCNGTERLAGSLISFMVCISSIQCQSFNFIIFSLLLYQSRVFANTIHTLYTYSIPLHTLYMLLSYWCFLVNNGVFRVRFCM